MNTSISTVQFTPDDAVACGTIPGSPTTSGAMPKFMPGNDSTTALGQQMKAILMNLHSAPESRQLRVEECLSAFMDTSFAHADEISSNEVLQEQLLSLVENTFSNSIDKGCRALRVLLDIKWKDQHDKRSRCLEILLRQAVRSTIEQDCAVIATVIGEVLQENMRTTTEILGEHLQYLINATFSNPDVNVRAACCEVLVKVVSMVSSLVKQNPTLLETLTVSCSPLLLLQHAMESQSTWLRKALISLVTHMVEENCYEVTPQLVSGIVEQINQYIATVTGEDQLVGVLSLIAGIATSPPFCSATWNYAAICSFLTERDWGVFSVDTRSLAAYTTGRVMYVLLADHEDLYNRVANRFLYYLANDEQAVVTQVLAVLTEMLDSENGIQRVLQCVEAIKLCIDRLPYMKSLFDVLSLIRARYGDTSMHPIYRLIEEFMRLDPEYVNFGKLNALLKFMGSRNNLRRPEFQQLRINLSSNRPEPVLIRSLPLLVTLGRTTQLRDTVVLMFHDSSNVRHTAISTVVSLCLVILQQAGVAVSPTSSTSPLTPNVSSSSPLSSPPPSPLPSSTVYSSEAASPGVGIAPGGGGVLNTVLNAEVSYAVARLLDVAVADRDPELRLSVLQQLSPPFYPYLCLQENLESLFMTRNDITEAARVESLVLLCRLHPFHPAVVHSHLLRSQEYMLRDIDALDSSISQAIYKAGQLRMCADHNSLLIHLNTVESVVLQRLRRQPFISRTFSMALLALIQSILEHSGPCHHCDVALFVQPVLTIVNGGDSSKRRRAALETLGAILSSFTITDTEMYTDIYRGIARIIRSEAEEGESVTLSAVKVLSIIGAANPVKIRKILRALESDEMEEEEEVVTPAVAHYKPRLRINPNVSDRYPSVALYYLVKAMQLTGDLRQQMELLTTVRRLMNDTAAHQKVVLLTQLLPQLQQWLADSERAHLYESVLALMGDLAALLTHFKDIIPSSTGTELLMAVKQFCALPQASQNPLSAYVVQLLDDLAKGLPAQEMRDHRWAVEFIHQRLSQNKNELDLIYRVVKSLESFLVVMHEKDLQLILPHVLQCIEPAKATPAAQRPKMKDINDACFDFINNVLVKQLSLIKECCAQIVHTIMWYVELSDNQEEMDVGLNTLASLIDAVKAPAQRFIMPVERVAEQNGYPSGYFTKLVQSAATELKVRAPLGSGANLSSDKPLSLTSHFPRLSQREFEAEMRSTLKMSDADLEVLDVAYNATTSETDITFRFCSGTNRTACFNLFMRKAQDIKSSLRRSLGILKVEQSVERPHPVDPAVINAIAIVPTAKIKKREQSWISWLHNTGRLLLKNSPFAALRCVAGVAERNSEFSRDLFPFAAAALVSQLLPSDRRVLMDMFTRAVEMAPYDTKQILFTFAEFMEAERGEGRPVYERVQKQSNFVIDREDTSKKFGINYDQDPKKGVIVTKISTDGLGAKAGVPLGGRLLSINGHPINVVGDIRGLLDGNTHVELTFAYMVEERRRSEESKALMNLNTLAKVAFNSQMHAKAIYFNEVVFEALIKELERVPDQLDGVLRNVQDVAERLIEFYGHLGLTMVANGLVKYLSDKYSSSIPRHEQFGFDEVGTLEQLHWWNEALRQYRSRMIRPQDGSLDISSFVGVLRCEESLGHISTVTEMVEQYWHTLSDVDQAEVAPYRAKAAFALGSWEVFDEMAERQELVHRFDTVERCAALFRLGHYDELLSLTQESRECLLEPFSESFNESYSRSYDTLVELQHLQHFEELVTYVHSTAERRTVLKRLWNRRVGQLAAKPAVLKTLISINSLVLTPREDMASQTVAIRALTKAQWVSVSSHMLKNLLGEHLTLPDLCREDPDLIHVYMRHLYATQSRHETYMLLKNVLHEVKVPLGDRQADRWGCCWLLLGEWTMFLFPDHGDEAIDELLRATELSPHNYAAFHSLGILHYDLSRDPSMQQDVQTDHHISAVIALFKSVQLSSDHSNSVMQDVLRILSIWFAHSNVKELNEAVHHGVEAISDHVWLNVIPQLIARIGITAKLARAILADLLVRVGTTYPQALIYPLTVAEKSPDGTRRLMAERVLSSIRVSNSKLVDEASLISNEMVRIAILWTEKWHALIHKAAYNQDNASSILRLLNPLYEELGSPSTPHERNFEKIFGQTLRRARVALQERSLDRAWTLLKQVYVQLGKLLGERKLYMSDVSPVLDGITNSMVAVPGTFIHGKPLVTIHKFHPRVYVMPSKQKPRRFGLDATNGAKFRFLLKGHEDLRQDERVMQFIGLINTIFLSDNASSSIGLTIPQYSVIPLTDNVGIIGWVESTETIYKMLETYRKERDVSIYEEVNIIIRRGHLQTIEDFHRLPKTYRKSLLSTAMECTPDDELRRIMWDRNDTCEQWLTHRETYGHTLAAMSMVGYVLGLGDRHLNNLMLQDNGSVVHIDFGDCFEVAMHRALYAEAVPFRLTRLLVSALGITGVDGVYRLTCELVMKNLRKHSENLLSILEAFIYDPLINWSLTVNENERSTSRHEGNAAAPSATNAAGGATNVNGPAGSAGAAAAAAVAGCAGTVGAGDLCTGGSTRMNMFDDVEQPQKEQQMQLSKSFAKATHASPAGGQTCDTGEEEIRNQQGNLALARVHAKLTGQDFGAVNCSFSAFRTSRRFDPEESMQGSSWGTNSDLNFGDSQKDYAGMPLLTTYLSLRTLTGGADCLDVPHQVDRLIAEATSLDNLADAYLTGWAPFW